jgi:hypothetical protein
MTIHYVSRVPSLFGVALCFACGGGDEGGAPGGSAGGTGEVAARCSIVDDTLTLPSDGTCVLGADQKLRYRYSGPDPECRGGRVEMGGLSGGRLTLNGLTIACEPVTTTAGEDEAGSPGAAGSTDVAGTGGAGGASAAVGAVDALGAAGAVGAADTVGPADAVGAGLEPPDEWFQLEDEFSSGCDLVNGADFEAIVSSDRRLIVVSQLNADVADFELPGLVLDADFNLLSEASPEPVARVRYKQDDEGARRPWLLRADGLAYSLDGGDGGSSPRAYVGVACESCRLVDGADAEACQAATPQPIPSEGIFPGRDLVARAGAVVDNDSTQLLAWSDFDSQRGSTCGLMNGADFELLIQDGALNIVPDALGADVDGVAVGSSVRRVDFSDPTRGASWHVIDSQNSIVGDVVFAADSAGQLRVWLLGNDGNVLDRALQSSGSSPTELAPVACDPCEFFAEPNGQCVPIDP